MKIGQALGAYQVLAKLGEGGMGVVYRARDTRLKRDVALKVLPEEFAADRDRLARFEREAQSLAALNHPHIAHVYGLEHWENTRVIAMELAEGETLDRRIARGPVSVSETIAIAIQLSQALEAAHDRGIIHRDLKPSNIKVDDQGAVKVLDFGLAKAFGAEPPETVANSPTITSPAMTHAGVILGTAAYMSPEQARGRVADKRADIWTFGCVVFEVLTPQRLFDGATISDTLAAVLREDIPWNQLPADTPDTFRQLLHRCLDRDPRTRLRDIGEARITLERALHDPATAHHDSESRPRSWLSTAVWIAALIAAGAAGYFAPRSDTTASNAPAPFRTHAAVSIPGEPIIDAAIAPDGTALVYSRANSLWLQRFSDWKAQPIAQTENGRRAFWSPDGQWLAYFAGRQLFRVPVSGGSPVAICELPTSTAVSIASARGAWREDGTILMANGDGPVLSVDSKGGTLSVFQSPVAGVLDYHDPAVLPDRDELVVTLHRSSGVDTIAVIENGTVKPLVQVPDGGVGGVVYSPTGHLLYHRTALAGAQVWAVGFSPRTLTTTGAPFPIGAGLQPTVARDGTLAMIAVGDPTSHETVWVNADGQKGATIAAPTPWRDGLNFSNDGRLLALVNSSGIFAIDLESGLRTRLTTYAFDSTPIWVGDGDRIAFARIANGTASVFVKRADATADEQLIARDARAPSASGDGRYLVFNHRSEAAAAAGEPWNAAWVDLNDPKSIRQFGKPHNGARFPVISPDARWMVYVSTESGRDEIHLTRFPSGEGKIQVSNDGANFQQWKPGSSDIVYRNARGEHKMVTIEGTTTPRVTAARKLFDWSLAYTPWYAIAPDGRIVTHAALPQKPIAPSVRIARNWTTTQ